MYGMSSPNSYLFLGSWPMTVTLYDEQQWENSLVAETSSYVICNEWEKIFSLDEVIRIAYKNARQKWGACQYKMYGGLKRIDRGVCKTHLIKWGFWRNQILRVQNYRVFDPKSTVNLLLNPRVNYYGDRPIHFSMTGPCPACIFYESTKMCGAGWRRARFRQDFSSKIFWGAHNLILTRRTCRQTRSCLLLGCRAVKSDCSPQSNRLIGSDRH